MAEGGKNIPQNIGFSQRNRVFNHRSRPDHRHGYLWHALNGLCVFNAYGNAVTEFVGKYLFHNKPFLDTLTPTMPKNAMPTKYLHTMIRVSDPAATMAFFAVLGLREIRRYENEAGKFTLIFLAAEGDESAPVELTHNWGEVGYEGGRNFGHLAYEVDDIYATCEKFMAAGITINRPPRCGHMAFVRTPDGISLELLQAGEALTPAEPWASMPNTGTW